MKTAVGFVGAGRWALTLALRLNANGCRVKLWEANSTLLSRFSSTRSHPDLPLDEPVPESIAVLGSLEDVTGQADVVVFAVPSACLAQAANVTCLNPATVRAVVTVTKGLDPNSLERMSVVLERAFPDLPVVVLAGPGIPFDMVRGDPTSLVAASTNLCAAELVRDVFTGGNLRVYSHDDVAGVELGAALKNVIAIAAGVADGLGLGINAKAALLSRGLAEMTRLGLALGTNPITYSGLSGVGDLIVTAFSDHSRNHTLGLHLGQGATPADAAARLNGVAEGAVTCRSALALAARHEVELPITAEVNRLVDGSSSPQESLDRLLRRRPRPEIWQ